MLEINYSNYNQDYNKIFAFLSQNVYIFEN